MKNPSKNNSHEKNLTRRAVVAALPMLSIPALFSSVMAHAQTANTGNIPPHCTTFNFADLPHSTNAVGNTSRPVMHGVLPTGEFFEMHETTLAPGQIPHPPHHHIHSELMLIRDGSVEFSMGDGSKILRSSIVTAGGVCYARSGEMHGLKNIGTVPANYFVIAIGNTAT